MPDKVFVDSNVFIYAKIKAQDAAKHLRAQSFLRSLEGEGVINSLIILFTSRQSRTRT